MNTANRWTRTWLASGVAAVTLALSFAASAQDIIDNSINPVWTPGGHYTAELDLKQNELTLLPLNGLDARLGVAQICAPGRSLDNGVYVVQDAGEGWVLQRTHPNGELTSLGSETVPLAACEDPAAPNNALRLPRLALLAMEQAAVGAIYIHE